VGFATSHEYGRPCCVKAGWVTKWMKLNIYNEQSISETWNCISFVFMAGMRLVNHGNYIYGPLTLSVLDTKYSS